SNPRATFPAAALGWVLTEEDFFNLAPINYLKIRASWGRNGNRDIANYSALSRIASGKTLNADDNGTAILLPTLAISTMENKDLKWEGTESYNLGIDFRILNSILTGSVDAYVMSTKDVLVERELPSLTGFERVYANLGEVQNKGVELSLSSQNMKRNNFEWRSNLIFSLNRNEIISITGEELDVLDDLGNVIGKEEPDDFENNWFIGQAKDVIWDFNCLGTWKLGEDEATTVWTQKPGDFRLEDVNGDSLLTNDDKQFQGYREPRFSWTLSNNFYFLNNFEASFVLYSQWGHKDDFEAARHDGKTRDRYNDWNIPYWTPENQIDDFSRLGSAPSQGVLYNVYFDRSFIRLEYVSLAYRLPSKVLDRTFIKNMKVTFNIRNAGVWAPGWIFGDPEDETRAQRIYSFALNLTL
ncbi:TonB-dependent receptor domain-containing protein, partial [Bacteroidota bacterium]